MCISESMEELSPEVIARGMDFLIYLFKFNGHYTVLTIAEKGYNSAIASQPSMASPHSYIKNYASAPLHDFLGFVYVADVAECIINYNSVDMLLCMYPTQ